MKLTLKPGERIEVSFSETDGVITVEFKNGYIRVLSDIKDSSGRFGEIYRENFKNRYNKEEI